MCGNWKSSWIDCFSCVWRDIFSYIYCILIVYDSQSIDFFFISTNKLLCLSTADWTQNIRFLYIDYSLNKLRAKRWCICIIIYVLIAIDIELIINLFSEIILPADYDYLYRWNVLRKTSYSFVCHVVSSVCVIILTWDTYIEWESCVGMSFVPKKFLHTNHRLVSYITYVYKYIW